MLWTLIYFKHFYFKHFYYKHRLRVIQQQVPLLLPCVNFAQITTPSVTIAKRISPTNTLKFYNKNKVFKYPNLSTILGTKIIKIFYFFEHILIRFPANATLRA